MASMFPPKKNTAFTLFFTLYKNDGTVVANPGTYTKKVSIDGGAVADIAASVTEEDTTYGQLSVILAAGEMDGDCIWVYITDNTAGTVPFTCALYTASATLSEVFTLLGTTPGAVWDVVRASHTTGGSFGEVSTVDDVGTAVWATATRQLTGSQTFALTGNITGNLSGTVGSVTGAVGSVTGNVGGNVAGSVGSVATGGITAASIATGAIDADSLAADAGTEIGTAVWATTTRQLTSAQSFTLTGNLSGNVTGSVGSVTGAVGSVTGSVGSVAAGGIASTSFVVGAINSAVVDTSAGAEIADAVWDEALSGHSTPGSAGLSLATASSGGVDPSIIADAIWNEATAGHASAGTTGKALIDILDDTSTSGVVVASIGTDAITASSIAADAIDASALSNDAIDAILDEVVEGSTTLRQLLRGVASSLMGKVNGAETTTINFRDLADSKNRIVAIKDASGNRTSVTLDLT